MPSWRRCRPWPRHGPPRRAVSLRVNPDVDAGTHPYISTGLKGNKFGIAHDEALAVYRRAASLPGSGGGHRLPHRVADHQIAPYLDALDRLLDLVEAVEADGIPIHHLDLGGGLGITYTDERRPRRRAGGASCWPASTPAATATARCCWSPAARWWAMPACC
jgi:diaminopimelate decarboxylase